MSHDWEIIKCEQYSVDSVDEVIVCSYWETHPESAQCQQCQQCKKQTCSKCTGLNCVKCQILLLCQTCVTLQGSHLKKDQYHKSKLCLACKKM